MINPNFLGPVAVTAVVANVGLMALCWREVMPRWKLAVILGILGVTFFDVVVLVNTHSANPVLAASMSTVIVASSYIFINRKAQKVQSFALQMVAGVGLIAASTLALLIYVFNGLINGPVLPVTALQSRINAWQYAWQGGLERPFFGWGDGVAWGDPLFRRMDLYWTVELLAHSHSGYLETLLDSGVLALLLLIAYLVFGCFEATKRGLSDSHSLIIFTFVFFYIYLSLFEPFLVTNYFTWTILVMFLAGPVTHMIGPRTHSSSLVQDRS
jgi:O-antigen ligase